MGEGPVGCGVTPGFTPNSPSIADMISQRTAGGRGGGTALGSGRGTLRLRAHGPATVEEQVGLWGGEGGS